MRSIQCNSLTENISSLAQSDIHLWYRVTEPFDQADIDNDLIVLSQDEQDRCARFVFLQDRRDYASAHSLLRKLLSHYCAKAPQSWKFVKGVNGKPYIDSVDSNESNVGFNLSHTRGLVACGVVRGHEIGVDVERVDRAPATLDIAQRYFSKTEYDMLLRTELSERFIRFIELWALKEAYIKATGGGLSEPLNSFGFNFSGRSGLAFNAPGGADSSQWTFALYEPVPHVRLAFAISSVKPVPWKVTASSFDGPSQSQILLPKRASWLTTD